MKKLLFLSIFFLSVFLSQAFGQGSGHALRFDGVDDYLQFNNENNFDFGANSYTLEAWVNTEGAISNDFIILYKLPTGGGSTGYGYRILAPGNVIRGGQQISGASNFVSYSLGASYDNTAWHHFVMVIDRSLGQQRMYLDGILLGTSSIIGVTDNTAPLVCGRFPLPTFGTYSYEKGKVDEVRIWNKALTQSEIRTNMCKKLTGSEAGLTAYYRMDEGADNTCSGGEDVCDLTGNNNHGTKF